MVWHRPDNFHHLPPQITKEDGTLGTPLAFAFGGGLISTHWGSFVLNGRLQWNPWKALQRPLQSEFQNFQMFVKKWRRTDSSSHLRIPAPRANKQSKSSASTKNEKNSACLSASTKQGSQSGATLVRSTCDTIEKFSAVSPMPCQNTIAKDFTTKKLQHPKSSQWLQNDSHIGGRLDRMEQNAHRTGKIVDNQCKFECKFDLIRCARTPAPNFYSTQAQTKRGW